MNQENTSQNILATVIIPSYSSPPYLYEVLEAIQQQETDFEYEVLIIDSGLSGEARNVVNHFDVHVHEIPNGEFSHGPTRNLGVQLANGKYVVFLTDDATPSNTQWLQHLIDGFSVTENVANVLAKQIPRPNHSPTVKRDIEETFKKIGSDQDITTVYKIEEGEEGWQHYLAHKEVMRFNSDTCAAYLRDALLKVPFRTVDYAEDQLAGQDLLEAGYARVYYPDAAVIHSHHYPMTEFLKRYYDEYRGLRNAFDYIDGVYWHTLLPAAIRGWYFDAKYIWSRDDYNVKKKLFWTYHALAVNTFRRIGAILGGRHDRLPSWSKRILSLEGSRRAKKGASMAKIKHLSKKTVAVFKDQGVSGVINGYKQYRAVSKLGQPEEKAKLTGGESYFYDFVSTYNPLEKNHFSHSEVDPNKKLQINWIIPDFNIGSGGHTTIFRMIKFLEEFGHTNTIYIYDKPGGISWTTPEQARDIIKKHFIDINATVHFGVKNMQPSDILMATSWHTAYPAYTINNTKKKCYFVQDFEPSFYPTSAEGLFAEQTYKMGYKTICASPWLEKKMKEEYKADAGSFYLAYNQDIYTPSSSIQRENNRIAFYARQVTPRRAFELGVLALDIVKKKRPTVEIDMFGWDVSGQHIPFEYNNLGVQTANELADIYNRSTVGLVFSLTNYSLLPQEMMACKLPIVECDGDNTRTIFSNNPGITLTEPNPHIVAEAIISLLDNPKKRDILADDAYKWVKQFTWKSAAEEIERLMYSL